jgi:N-acetylglucosaminyl-diphospho-decaprenol L-rhamnosyltransferase
LSYSIVVVSWECADHLAVLVDSMNGHLSSRPELIVVDNASADDPERAAGAYDGESRFVPLPDNRGYGAAANLGVESATGDVVVTLNPDTELLDSGLDALAAFTSRERALAGPRLLNPDGSDQPSASGPVVGSWPWVSALVPGALQPAAMRARTEPWRLRRNTRVSWLSGACVAGPRELLLALGPFDPAIHLYGEDMDLGLRAQAAGISSWFCPELCRITHHGRGSTDRRWSQGPAQAIESNWRVVARRAYGPRRERRAWKARKLNLALRVGAKRALGRDADWERSLLRAARGADHEPTDIE